MPLLFPEVLNERTYATMPDFIWQAPLPKHYANAQFEYLLQWLGSPATGKETASIAPQAVKPRRQLILKFVYFFLWPEFCALLLALPWVLRDRRTRYLQIQLDLPLGMVCGPLVSAPLRGAHAWQACFWILSQGSATSASGHHGNAQSVLDLARCVLFALVLAPIHQRSGICRVIHAKHSDFAYRAKYIKELDACRTALDRRYYRQVSDGRQIGLTTTLTSTAQNCLGEGDSRHQHPPAARLFLQPRCLAGRTGCRPPRMSRYEITGPP